LEIGQSAKRIWISVTSVWSAEMQNGASRQSYEGIGYHACTAQLMKGFIDSGAEIWVCRRTKEGTIDVKIK
jgi:hypothetical protein